MNMKHEKKQQKHASDDLSVMCWVGWGVGSETKRELTWSQIAKPNHKLWHWNVYPAFILP